MGQTRTAKILAAQHPRPLVTTDTEDFLQYIQ